MSNDIIATPDQNAQAIAQLTAAVNSLVAQFIRPNAQQANANRETLDEVIALLSRHAQGLLGQEQRLDQMVDRLESIEGIVAQNAQQIAATAQQQEANAQQISQNAEAITVITQRLEQFDTRLENTRQLVAKNSSNIAQLTVKQDRNADAIAALGIKQERNADAIAAIGVKQDLNASQISTLVEENRAFRESQQSQLAAIIGNGRRLDRLEQQAS